MSIGGIATGGSAAQVQRRSRILDAAVELASEGGYDAVQMREAADRADVALGTLYRYFSSKNHLLVSALDRELDRVKDLSRSLSVPGETPHERMAFVFEQTARALDHDRRLSEALIRAYVFADASVGDLIDRMCIKLTALFGHAMSGDPTHEPTDEEVEIIHVIADVWLASLVAWATGRKQPEDVTESLNTATRLLLA